MQTGVPSEYTRMILFQTDEWNQGLDAITIQGVCIWKRFCVFKLLTFTMIICDKLSPNLSGTLDKPPKVYFFHSAITDHSCRFFFPCYTDFSLFSMDL